MTEINSLLEGDFVSYLGSEESNLLASLVNFGSSLGLFQELDQLYREPLKRTSIDSGNIAQYIFAMLYIYSHSQLYFSITSFFRCHSKEAFAVARSAIDAALTAYRIAQEPSSASKYVDNDNSFKFIKSTIEQALKKDPSSYPLAVELIKLHEFCSQWGSHADIGSVVLGTQILESIEGDTLLQHYFDRRTSLQGRFHLNWFLNAYLKIYLVFFRSLRQQLSPDERASLEQRIMKLAAILLAQGKEYKQELEKESEPMRKPPTR